MLSRLYAKLLEYAQQTAKPEISEACSLIMQDIEFKQRSASLALPWNASEVTALRLLISKRIKSHNLPLSLDKQVIEKMIQLEGDLFGELQGGPD